MTARVWQTGFLAMLATFVWTAGADAQIRFSSDLMAEVDASSDIPPELEMTGELPSPTGDHGGVSTDSQITRELSTENLSLGDGHELIHHDGHSILEGEPYDDEFAPLLSSGTWFRRGYWYTRQEVVLYSLDNYKNFIFGFDTSVSGVFGRATRILGIKRTSGGLAANARLSLGRFLYRDAKNRDHTMEFTFTGPGKWSATADTRSLREDQLINAFDPFAPGFGSFPPDFIAPDARAFGGVNMMSYRYVSKLENYEWNYRMRRRMKRDVLMLDSDGKWNREMQPELLYGYLFGIRWLNVDEEFDFHAEAVLRDARGDARVLTSNNLVGFQFGGDATYQHKRWSIDFSAKAGPYVNFAGRNFFVNARDVDPITTDPVFLNIDNDRADRDVLGFIGECGLHATYYAKPNLSFRVGWEAMWVNSLSLAFRELDNADFGQASAVRDINTAGGLQYMGFSTGLEYHW